MEKRRKRKESAKERKREKGEKEEAHIKYVRDANKNPQRTRARGRYDLSRLHADTSILISLSPSLSPRKRRVLLLRLWNILVPAHNIRETPRGMIQIWLRSHENFMRISRASDYQKGREGIKRNVKFIVLKQEIPANFPYIVTFDSIKDIQPRSLYIREIVLLLNFNVLIQDHKRVVSISLSVGFARRRTAVSISRRQSNHVNQGWHY